MEKEGRKKRKQEEGRKEGRKEGRSWQGLQYLGMEAAGVSVFIFKPLFFSGFLFSPTIFPLLVKLIKHTVLKRYEDVQTCFSLLSSREYSAVLFLPETLYRMLFFVSINNIRKIVKT